MFNNYEIKLIKIQNRGFLFKDESIEDYCTNCFNWNDKIGEYAGHYFEVFECLSCI